MGTPGTAILDTIVLGAARVPGWFIPPRVASAVVALPTAFSIPDIQIFNHKKRCTTSVQRYYILMFSTIMPFCAKNGRLR